MGMFTMAIQKAKEKHPYNPCWHATEPVLVSKLLSVNKMLQNLKRLQF